MEKVYLAFGGACFQKSSFSCPFEAALFASKSPSSQLNLDIPPYFLLKTIQISQSVFKGVTEAFAVRQSDVRRGSVGGKGKKVGEKKRGVGGSTWKTCS